MVRLDLLVCLWKCDTTSHSCDVYAGLRTMRPVASQALTYFYMEAILPLSAVSCRRPCALPG